MNRNSVAVKVAAGHLSQQSIRNEYINNVNFHEGRREIILYVGEF